MFADSVTRSCRVIGVDRWIIVSDCVAWLGRDSLHRIAWLNRRENGRKWALLFCAAMPWFWLILWKRLICCIWGDNPENHCARMALVGFWLMERCDDMGHFRSYIHISVYSDISLEHDISWYSNMWICSIACYVCPCYNLGMRYANTFLFTDWHASCLCYHENRWKKTIDILNEWCILSLVMLADALWIRPCG